MMPPSAAAEHYVGIDLGGTKVRGGVVGPDEAILAELTEPTRAEGGMALVNQIVKLVRELGTLSYTDNAPIRAVGIGGPGVPDRASGGFTLAPNLGDAGVDIVGELERELGRPVALDNDANVAALGELAAGAGRDVCDFAFVSLGTGVGMGLVLHGRLIRGAAGAAGEIGYLPFGTDPLNLSNQRRGALEEAVAGDVLAARYGPDATAERVFELACAGDRLARSAVDHEAKWVAHAVAAVDAVVNPALFILGGGIGSRSTLLVAVRSWLTRLGKPGIDIRTTELGSAGPIIGAAHLAKLNADLEQQGVPS